jgi:hypothetical protein
LADTEQLECCGELVLRITDVTYENRHEKYVAAVGELSKALRVKAKLGNAAVKERPLPIVEHYEEKYRKKYLAVINEIVVQVARKLGLVQKADVPFRLKGRFIIDPESGIVLSQRQWDRFAAAIDDYLSTRTDGLAEQMNARQTALGIILQRMEARGVDPETVRPEDIKFVIPETLKATQELIATQALKNVPAFNTAETGLYVTDINNRVQRDIMRIVNQGLREQITNKELATRLFLKRGDWNKDWDRIATTESQNAFNDGYLISQMDQAEEDEDTYMIGVGAAGACPICVRDIIGKVVKLTDGPPQEDGGDRIKDPYTDTAIWPGKTSVGVSAREEVAVITRHPWCRCRWTEWVPPKRKQTA